MVLLNYTIVLKTVSDWEEKGFVDNGWVVGLTRHDTRIPCCVATVKIHNLKGQMLSKREKVKGNNHAFFPMEGSWVKKIMKHIKRIPLDHPTTQNTISMTRNIYLNNFFLFYATITGTFFKAQSSITKFHF
jgi:hypothetical protein